MSDDHGVLARMRADAGEPTGEVVRRCRELTSAELAEEVSGWGLDSDDVAEIVEHWETFRHDERWGSTLASLVGMVERQRGDIDAPIAIWPDLEDSGVDGRLLFFYVFALAAPGARDFLGAQGVPDDVVDRTLSIVSRQAGLHRRKWGSLGVDAGWWLLVTLRGEILHVKSLHFHRVTLGVGNFSPHPWYDEEEVARRGVGFRRGDASIGIHIPDGTDLRPAALDETFDEARRLVAEVWPTRQRRLATCQSWMMDDQLRAHLAPTSNILAFQDRFTLLPGWIEDDADVLEFVFRRPGVDLADLPRSTSLERAVLNILEGGHPWRIRTGWLDFDGGGGRA